MSGNKSKPTTVPQPQPGKGLGQDHRPPGMPVKSNNGTTVRPPDPVYKAPDQAPRKK